MTSPHPPLSLGQLRGAHCVPAGRDAALDAARLQAQLAVLPRWAVRDGALQARYAFGAFLETLAFVNALAWMAHGQDHHPDLAIGYDHCSVRWHTHSAGGITLNDLICAARCDALFEGRRAP